MNPPPATFSPVRSQRIKLTPTAKPAFGAILFEHLDKKDESTLKLIAGWAKELGATKIYHLKEGWKGIDLETDRPGNSKNVEDERTMSEFIQLVNRRAIVARNQALAPNVIALSDKNGKTINIIDFLG